VRRNSRSVFLGQMVAQMYSGNEAEGAVQRRIC
jgi:hypothetical protein